MEILLSLALLVLGIGNACWLMQVLLNAEVICALNFYSSGSCQWEVWAALVIIRIIELFTLEKTFRIIESNC